MARRAPSLWSADAAGTSGTPATGGRSAPAACGSSRTIPATPCSRRPATAADTADRPRPGTLKTTRAYPCSRAAARKPLRTGPAAAAPVVITPSVPRRAGALTGPASSADMATMLTITRSDVNFLHFP